MKNIGNTITGASYEVNTLGLEVGSVHKRLLAYFNDMHEARATGDTQTIEDLEEFVPTLLDEFEATECQNTPNPKWLSNKMRGGWNVARGDIEAALEAEMTGYRHANEETSADGDDTAHDRRRSVSASNIADQLWRLGRAEEGMPWAQLSVELWPTNGVNYLVLAIAAYYAGYKTQADQIFRSLQQVADFRDEADLLSKCMIYERELRAMTDLPAVKNLIEKMEVK